MADKFLQIRSSMADFPVFTEQSGEDGMEVRVRVRAYGLCRRAWHNYLTVQLII